MKVRKRFLWIQKEKNKSPTLRSGFCFICFYSQTWLEPSLVVSPPSLSTPLSLLGHFQQLSHNSLQLFVSCGCRNRDLSALIQEFLKSVMPWVLEASLYTFSFPILNFSGSVSLLLDVSLFPGPIQIHLEVHAIGLLACLPISLAPLPPSSF